MVIIQKLITDCAIQINSILWFRIDCVTSGRNIFETPPVFRILFSFAVSELISKKLLFFMQGPDKIDTGSV
jgi:hypothetical protein